MKTISLITPVHRAGVVHLADTYRSLARQELPAGWDWEWLIQEDGEDVEASSQVPLDSRIHIDQSRHGGPHVARTVALGRSHGELIKTLDADDMLTDGALARDIAVLDHDAHAATGWTTSAVLDLMPDGTLKAFSSDPSNGPVTRGDVLSHWETHYRPQVHPATMCARRSLVMALGGWMALPASGDTGLLLGLDALADGWFIQTPGLHYRQHPGQITADARHSHGTEWEARMAVIGEHARALHALMTSPLTMQD